MRTRKILLLWLGVAVMCVATIAPWFYIGTNGGRTALLGGFMGYLVGISVWAFRPTAKMAMAVLGLLPTANWMWFVVGLVGAVLIAAGPVVGASYLGVVGGSISIGLVRWAAS